MPFKSAWIGGGVSLLVFALVMQRCGAALTSAGVLCGCGSVMGIIFMSFRPRFAGRIRLLIVERGPRW